jgi:hypothetical protein
VPRVFDILVVAASAMGGATMAGAHLILPGVGLFDRAAGGFLPALEAVAESAVNRAHAVKAM